MATDKFLKRVAGKKAMAEGTGAQSSAGSADAGKLVALNSSGDIDASMLPPGVGGASLSVPTSENLAAGAFVDLYQVSTVLTARNADASAASAGKIARGFTISAVTSPANATVLFAGEANTGLSGLTIGSDYYLDDGTPGAVTATEPTTTGHLSQYLGRALSATEIVFDPGEPIILA